MAKTVAELIARSLLDREFRGRLLGNPAEALSSEGVEPTPEALAEVAKLDPAQLEKAGKLLEKRFLTSGRG
jgi:hypothetical protein